MPSSVTSFVAPLRAPVRGVQGQAACHRNVAIGRGIVDASAIPRRNVAFVAPPQPSLSETPVLIAEPLVDRGSNGVWLSLARALRSGRRSRWFKSSHPDFPFHGLRAPRAVRGRRGREEGATTVGQR